MIFFTCHLTIIVLVIVFSNDIKAFSEMLQIISFVITLVKICQLVC